MVDGERYRKACCTGCERSLRVKKFSTTDRDIESALALVCLFRTMDREVELGVFALQTKEKNTQNSQQRRLQSVRSVCVDQ